MKRAIIIIFCIYFFIPSYIYAYDYLDPFNAAGVESDRSDIYSLKQMYEELSGIDENGSHDYEDAVNNKYWWPIGSEETTTVDGKEFATGEPEETVITSWFGTTGDVSSHANGHGAIDIANYRGEGVTNIIASKDGVVVYPTENDPTNCPAGGLGNSCGGGYGNYVVIEHSDGNYTLYGHMYANSITVKAGDTVKQGQVIGKMGTSGDSSGTHLHFEFRLGENSSAAKVDPLDYVDPDNPRPLSTSSSLVDYINHFEGVGCSGQQSEEGDNYIACVGVDGVTTIGHGVVWEFNRESFEKYGYTNVSAGTRVPKDVVDTIQNELIEDAFGTPIRNGLAEAGIDDLKDYQIDALISRAYNCGPYSVLAGTSYSFIPAYEKYNGNYRMDEMYNSTSGIWSDSMSAPITSNGAVLAGLQRRRVSEWLWFTTGEVDFFDSGFNPGQYSW